MTRTIPLLFLGLMACTTKDGNGVQSNELRELGSFEAVRNNSSVPILVDVGPALSVEVFCDENLLSLVETEVHGDTIEVNLPAEIVIVPTATCEVAITMPSLIRAHVTSTGDLFAQGELSDLDYVRNSGWGDVQLEGIATAELRLISQGRGRMLLAGTAEVVAMDNTGAGGIEAGQLISADANVYNAGSGDITATVTERATVQIVGDGDVVLHGDPETLEVDDDGCGDLY